MNDFVMRDLHSFVPLAERGRGERRDRGRSDRSENDEGRKTAGRHKGGSENRRQTAKRDRKRQAPKGR